MNEVILAINPCFGLFWSNATGAGHTLSGIYVKYGLRGSADIIGCTASGRFAALEIKTGYAKQSTVQKNFQLAVEKNGGIYLVIRSVDQAITQLKETLNG